MFMKQFDEYQQNEKLSQIIEHEKTTIDEGNSGTITEYVHKTCG